MASLKGLFCGFIHVVLKYPCASSGFMQKENQIEEITANQKQESMANTLGMLRSGNSRQGEYSRQDAIGQVPTLCWLGCQWER